MKQTTSPLTELKRIIKARRRNSEETASLTAQCGALMREVRYEMDMTMRDFAAQLGIDFTYLSKIENGHLPASVDVLERLVKVVEGK